MRWITRFLKYILLPVACIVGGLLIGALAFRSYEQGQIAARRAITTPDGIETLETVSIGGVEQWISIRGLDQTAPILLYVHGGPGSPMMPLAHGFQDPLERHFVVVQWDQRGTGKSRRGSMDLEGVTIDRMVEDTVEQSRYLRERFPDNPLVLLGHSWGSLLGVHAIKREPELYAAYVGVGQVVNMLENESVTYRYTVEEARSRGDDEGLAALEGLVPYPDDDFEAMVEKMGVQRRFLLAYGGSMRVPGGVWTILSQFAVAPEYSLRDNYNYLVGMFDSLDVFMEPLMAVDLNELGAEFDVPMIIVSGAYDYQVPFEIAERWFKTIEAPQKEFHWMHESAHMPMCTEPEAFGALLRHRVLPIVKRSPEKPDAP